MKYECYKTHSDVVENHHVEDTEVHEDKIENEAIEETLLYKELRKFRLNKSHAEAIKPYMVFSDRHLKDLVIKKPRNKEELSDVSGFGEVKIAKYGDEIISIIMNCESET